MTGDTDGQMSAEETCEAVGLTLPEVEDALERVDQLNKDLSGAARSLREDRDEIWVDDVVVYGMNEAGAELLKRMMERDKDDPFHSRADEIAQEKYDRENES